MIKRSELITKTALWTGADHDSVQEIARRLGEAGHMSLGRPGRYGGAAQTARDAANLLGAVATGEPGVRAARRFSQLQEMTAPEDDFDEDWENSEYFLHFRLERQDTIADAFTKIIYAYSRGFAGEQQAVEAVLMFPVIGAMLHFSHPTGAPDFTIHYAHKDFIYPINNKGGAAVDLDAWFMKKHGFLFTCKIETERTIFPDIFVFLGRLLVDAPEPWPWEDHPWADRRAYLDDQSTPWKAAVMALDP